MRGITGRTQPAENLFHPMFEEGRSQGRLSLLGMADLSVAVPVLLKSVVKFERRQNENRKGREGKGRARRTEDGRDGDELSGRYR